MMVMHWRGRSDASVVLSAETSCLRKAISGNYKAHSLKLESVTPPAHGPRWPYKEQDFLLNFCAFYFCYIYDESNLEQHVFFISCFLFFFLIIQFNQ